MSAIAVSCHRWLGLGSKYAVRVDGQEVGRLGRRVKSVHADVEAGSHSVVIEYNGNQTPALHLDVAETDEVLLTLDFGSPSALVAKYTVTPWKQRISDPIGELPLGFMTLRQSD